MVFLGGISTTNGYTGLNGLSIMFLALGFPLHFGAFFGDTTQCSCQLLVLHVISLVK